MSRVEVEGAHGPREAASLLGVLGWGQWAARLLAGLKHAIRYDIVYDELTDD